MKLKLVAVGTRLDDWIARGFQEYARRMPRDMPLELIEVPSAPGRVRDPGACAREAAALLAKVSEKDHVVALDVTGREISSEMLAERLEVWRGLGRDVALLVGGADGLHESCLTRADERISLSALTFPHGLVRIIIAEQLYRSWTLLTGHPYHRA
jgi:23S rRNA (pseudouridine1915-N3)-methyltransferase